MKNKLKINGSCQKPFWLAGSVAILMLMVHSASFAGGTNNVSARTNSPRNVKKPLTEQIRGYILIDDAHFGNLKKGVIVVSFQVDQNNRLRQVTSHSQIASLDCYLASSLEGKAVQAPAHSIPAGEVQFIKLRISIEK
jgi:hypothetical protein